MPMRVSKCADDDEDGNEEDNDEKPNEAMREILNENYDFKLGM